MNEPEFREDSFFHILIGDVVSARQRLADADDPTHRRELIRTVFSAIEGLHWSLKQSVLIRASNERLLSSHEYAALQEETCSVDERGKIHSHPRFLPLPTSIRLVIEIIKRYHPDYLIDLKHQGWVNLRAAVKIRNRLIHPKKLGDLLVTDKEISQAMSAFHWLLALVLEATHISNANAEEKDD